MSVHKSPRLKILIASYHKPTAVTSIYAAQASGSRLISRCISTITCFAAHPDYMVSEQGLRRYFHLLRLMRRQMRKVCRVTGNFQPRLVDSRSLKIRLKLVALSPRVRLHHVLGRGRKAAARRYSTYGNVCLGCRDSVFSFER
jgi:hypothetical protein